MTSSDYAITFACHNQLEYTRQCVNSMIRHGTPLERLVVIDNGSNDETRDYLQTLPLGGCIFNSANLGCGVAWNQGALALQAEWTIIMNNDVVVSAHWIENLIGTAQDKGLSIIAPALVEGPLDYDFEAFAPNASTRMKNALRVGGRHAVCVAVHKSVWLEVGYFPPVPKLLGYEDTLFFHEADTARIPVGMTGAAWIHHYGSVTQTALKQERGFAPNSGLGDRRNYRLLNQSWLERKLKKRSRLKQLKAWRDQELAAYGISLHGLREHGRFMWI